MTTTATPPKPRRRFPWRVVVISLVVILLIACIAGAFYYRRTTIPDQGEIPSELVSSVVPVEQRDLIQSVQVVGGLEPRDRTKVAFPEGVRVREVLIKLGDRVDKGQVLARLETRDLELKVTSSKSQLDQAEQALKKLEQGPSESEKVKATAAVARARAALAALQQEVRQVDIDTARQQLEKARKVVADLQSGVPTSAVRDAEQALLSAQEALDASKRNLEKVRDSASRAKLQAQQTMERGQQSVIQAQRAYSDAFWEWDYVQRTGRHPTETITNEQGQVVHRPLSDAEKEQFKREFDDATNSLKRAEEDQKNLVDAYDQARKDEVTQVQEAELAIVKAERALDKAKLDYDQQKTDGTAAELLKARKDLADAEKALNDLINNPERPARRAEAEAALLEAIANEKKLSEGADPIEVAKAKSEVEVARAGLAKAEADLDAATLKAPIQGTIVGLTLKEGTLTTSNDAVDIADLNSFLLRSRITEQDVAQVKVGMNVNVNVDSVPGESFPGQVTLVSQLPESSQGGDPSYNPSGGLGGLYPISIVVTTDDPRLRVGMATTAFIEVVNIPNVLVIPFQAVEQRPDGAYVRRVIGTNPDGTPKTEDVLVTTGMLSGDSVEITSGLQLGDNVLLQSVPPPTGPMMPGGPMPAEAPRG